jgi:hypothetical protein
MKGTSHLMGLLAAIAAMALYVIDTHAQSAQDAPLGLTWGESASQTRAHGIELSETASREFGMGYVATRLEKSVADQSAVLLFFGYDDRLWRIVINSREFANDPTGYAVLKRYRELSSVLSEKYGSPSEVHRLGDSIFNQQQYFLAGIRGGNTKWYSNFESPNAFVQLGLSADDSSTGRWRLIYENKDLRRNFDLARHSKEKGSL